MKKILLLFVALIVGLFVCAQKPPQKVIDNFNRKFKNAPKVKWTREDENEWEAEFRKDGEEMSASYNDVGKWKSTGIKISKKELPDIVRITVAEEYRGWIIEEVESCVGPKFRGYELRLEKGKEEVKILVTKYGKIKVNKEPKEKKVDTDEK